jgi:hypothetical protein
VDFSESFPTSFVALSATLSIFFLAASATFLIALPTALISPPTPFEPLSKAVPSAKAVPPTRAFARPPPEVTLPLRKSSSVCL